MPSSARLGIFRFSRLWLPDSIAGQRDASKRVFLPLFARQNKIQSLAQTFCLLPEKSCGPMVGLQGIFGESISPASFYCLCVFIVQHRQSPAWTGVFLYLFWEEKCGPTQMIKTF